MRENRSKRFLTRLILLLISTEHKPVPKPSVPSRSERPVHGAVSSKNFIVSNAVQVILAANKIKASSKKTDPFENYVSKPDYGMPPAYLKKVKEQVELEKDVLREYLEETTEESSGPAVDTMSEHERSELIKDLKRKWGAVNKHYQRAAGGAPTSGKSALKEKCEKEMKQIEADIKLLSKGTVKIVLE